jgi:hypothetical protein
MGQQRHPHRRRHRWFCHHRKCRIHIIPLRVSSLLTRGQPPAPDCQSGSFCWWLFSCSCWSPCCFSC